MYIKTCKNKEQYYSNTKQNAMRIRVNVGEYEYMCIVTTV
jgi:hypothetical protein